MDNSVFYSTGSVFKVVYMGGASGFTTPKWKGYYTEAIIDTPEIAIEQPPGSRLVDDDFSYKNFGTVKVGQEGRSKTFTIMNTGLAELTVSDVLIVALAESDFIVTDLGETSIDPGASTTFKVTFKPTYATDRLAKILIKSNDSNCPTFIIRLRGLGVE